MLFSRTTSGLDFVDVSVGGLYSNRTYILRGPSQSGRTTVCLQFLISGIENGENGIMISSERIENVILKAEQLGLSLDKYLMDNRLVLIEYPKEILTGHYQYGGIIQLLGEIEEYIQHFNCQRLVFDTLTPLLIKPREQEQANYIYSLMNALESLNTTALVTTGSPNSAAATRIIDLLEDAAVGSFVTDLIPSEDDPQRIFTIRKMVNPMNPPQSMKIRIEYGQGIVQDFSVEEEVKKRKKLKNLEKALTDLPLSIAMLDTDEETQAQLEEMFPPDCSVKMYEDEDDFILQVYDLDCDVFLLNTALPKIKWREIVSLLREIYPKLPIFLMADSRDTKLTTKVARQFGADGLFIKPLPPADLIGALKKTLREFGTLEEVIMRYQGSMSPDDLPEDMNGDLVLVEKDEDELPSPEDVSVTLPEFREKLQMQVLSSSRENTQFALVSFKMVYTREMQKLSHMPQGLEMVKKIAGAISVSLRDVNDTFCRYMDKLVVMLENTDQDGAKAFAGRVLNELRGELAEKLNIQLNKHLTILTATAIYPSHGTNAQDLLHRVTDVSSNFVKTIS